MSSRMEIAQGTSDQGQDAELLNGTSREAAAPHRIPVPRDGAFKTS